MATALEAAATPSGPVLMVSLERLVCGLEDLTRQGRFFHHIFPYFHTIPSEPGDRFFVVDASWNGQRYPNALMSLSGPRARI